MKKDELHARVLYLYQILRHYSDSEHPLTTQQILKIMDEKYHIQIHRVSVQNYVEILNSDPGAAYDGDELKVYAQEAGSQNVILEQKFNQFD